jgi:hypothetical protein
MRTRGLLPTILLAACAANAQPPEPSLSPVRTDGEAEVRDLLQGLAEPEPETTLPADIPLTAIEDGSQLVQGGLAYGTTVPGSILTLDGTRVPVDDEGRFVLGFGRDHGRTALLRVAYPGGTVDVKTLDIEDRTFPEEAIDGVPSNTVNPYTEEDLEAIRVGTEKKNAARQERSTKAMWTAGFDWPARGRVTGVFGSRRIYNGEPRNPHSGVDVARPLTMESPMDFIGTPVLAPSDGIVRLAEPDMFFEGGLILIDHGQNLETALLHLSKIDVAPGDLVKKGDKVGEVGMTGRATGPHVHWSLKWHDTLIDPQLLVGEM